VGDEQATQSSLTPELCRFALFPVALGMTALLALDGISKSFGALKVADRLSLALESDEALGILGPNGAGKTTLFNLISGDFQPDAGRVLLAGAAITALAPHLRCRAGIGR